MQSSNLIVGQHLSLIPVFKLCWSSRKQKNSPMLQHMPYIFGKIVKRGAHRFQKLTRLQKISDSFWHWRVWQDRLPIKFRWQSGMAHHHHDLYTYEHSLASKESQKENEEK